MDEKKNGPGEIFEYLPCDSDSPVYTIMLPKHMVPGDAMQFEAKKLHDDLLQRRHVLANYALVKQLIEILTFTKSMFAEDILSDKDIQEFAKEGKCSAGGKIFIRNGEIVKYGPQINRKLGDLENEIRECKKMALVLDETSLVRGPKTITVIYPKE